MAIALLKSDATLYIKYPPMVVTIVAIRATPPIFLSVVMSVGLSACDLLLHSNKPKAKTSGLSLFMQSTFHL